MTVNELITTIATETGVNRKSVKAVLEAEANAVKANLESEGKAKTVLGALRKVERSKDAKQDAPDIFRLFMRKK